MKRAAPRTLWVSLLVSGALCSFAIGQAAAQGQWKTLPYPMPINPVHVALMNNGTVLIVAGSGNLQTNTSYQAAVWDPRADTITTQPVGWDMFCNGMVVLPDGRVFINGGNLRYDPFLGEPRSSAYDATTGRFTDLENMAHGRWYPTVTTLGDGSVMTFSGLSEFGLTNTAVEIYKVGSGWSQEYQSGWTPPLYPRMHLLPDGHVFVSGPAPVTMIFNPTTKAWFPVATTNYSGTRTYGSSVLLPLTPADGYKPRVMIFGGGDPATATTEIIDLSAATPQWQYGPPMSQPRIEMNATILPNGKVLALGGSAHDEDATTASLNADLYDPGMNTVSSAGGHGYDMDQRLVKLSHSVGSGVLNVAAPPNGSIAPPGYYMLFILNSAGVPSLASFVHLSAFTADFALSATPASRTVLPSRATSYTATVTPGTGFTGTVSFGVSGLPSGAVATFDPTSVNGAGSTTMNVTTSVLTPLGAYQLTITGNSGGVVHSTTVTLIVGFAPFP